MKAHDAFTSREVMGRTVNDPPVFAFPIPHLGPESPSVAAKETLVRLTLQFGLAILCLRLVAMFHPDAAVFVARLAGVTCAVLIVTRWFTREAGLMQWPLWLGVGILIVIFAHRLLSPLVGNGLGADVVRFSPFLPYLFETLLVGLTVPPALAPIIKNVSRAQTRSGLLVCLIAVTLGGHVAAAGYVPRSDFGAWNALVTLLFMAWLGTWVIAEEYLRYQRKMAENLCVLPDKDRNHSCPGRDLHLPGLMKLALPLVVGNLAFLSTLHLPVATPYGLVVTFFAFLVVNRIATPLKLRTTDSVPVAWDCLVFFLTYNRQGVFSSKNIYQCRDPFAAQGTRLLVVGLAVAACILGVFHIAGGHSSRETPVEPSKQETAYWMPLLLQNHPDFLADRKFFEKNVLSKLIYRRHAQEVGSRGDCSLASPLRAHTLGGLLVRMGISLILGPFVFLFILAATQGNHLAKKLDELPEPVKV